MSVGLVLGPGLSALADDELADGIRTRVRGSDESPTARAAGLRELFSAGADSVLVVDHAFPVRPDWARSGGLFAIVADHINLTGDNPLVGPNADEWGPRFPDLTDAWDPATRRAIRERAVQSGVLVHEGVVAGVAGAARTAAELEMLRMIGADMASTGFVYEAIVARHASRKVAGIAVLGGAGTELPGDAAAVAQLVRLALDTMTDPSARGGE